VPDPAGLRGYPAAAKKAAADSGTQFLDLNAISTQMLTALGPENGRAMYVDGQHTRSYGAYMNSRSVVYGIGQLKMDLAKELVEGAVLDPAHPVPVTADFAVPLEAVPRIGGRGRGTSLPATRAN
jgi:hypothetical protein